MNISLQIAANLAVVFEPFLPFTSEKLLTMLDLGKPGWDVLGRADLLKEGHTIGEPSLLFEKVEDSEIEKQLEKLANTKKQNETKAIPVAPQRETVNYDEFSKMDIRTGTILEAERVPKTDKLLKLTIDTGIDKRTVVSGIAGYFTPEQAIGKKVSMLQSIKLIVQCINNTLTNILKQVRTNRHLPLNHEVCLLVIYCINDIIRFSRHSMVNINPEVY